MTDLIADFNGFDTPQENWSKLPHALIDLLPLFPGGTELKVVLYILRHTWGYQEYDDAKKITMDEFMRGRKRRDGSRIDSGVGMSEPAIRKALSDAEAHGLIVIEIDDHDKARIEKHYCIRKSGVKVLPPEGKTFTLGTKESLPRTEKDTLGKKLEERKKDPAPESGAVIAPVKKERPRDPLFDAVQVHIFGIPLEEKASGGRIAKISNWLNGKYEGRGAQAVGKISKAAEPQHVEKFAAWCHREGFTPPLDVVKFTERWRKWAASMNGSSAHRSDPLAGLTIITNDPAVNS